MKSISTGYAVLFLFLLASCGGGGGGVDTTSTPNPIIDPDPTPTDDPGTTPDADPTPTDNHSATPEALLGASQGQALLGPIVDASVFVYPSDDYDGTPICSATTSGADAAEGPGVIDLSSCAIEEELLYFLIVRGGEDIDADDDGVLDETPTAKVGALRALITGAEIIEGGWRINILSELAFSEVSADLLSGETQEHILARLDSIANRMLESDLNGDGAIDASDLSAFLPTQDTGDLKKGDQELLDDLLTALLEGSQSDITSISREYLLSALDDLDLQQQYPDFSFIDLITKSNLIYMIGTMNTGSSEHLIVKILELNDQSEFELNSEMDIELSEGGTQSVSGFAFEISDDDLLYFSGSALGLVIIDIADSSAPEILGSLEFDRNLFNDIAIVGDYAYLSGLLLDEAIFYMVDVSDPSNPNIANSIEGLAFSMVQDGDILYTYGSGLSTYDISSPLNPVLLDNLSFPSGSGRHIQYSQGFVYIPTTDELQTIDVFNVSNPNEIIDLGSAATGLGFINTLLAESDSLYALSADALLSFQIAEDGSLSLIDSRAAVGSYGALVATDTSIIISDTLNTIAYSKDALASFNPSFSSYDTDRSANQILLDGDFAYVGDDASLLIFDIGSPELGIELLGDLAVIDWIEDMAIEGDHLYIANSTEGLSVIDISDKSNPVKLGGNSELNVTENTSYVTGAVAVSGDYAYTYIQNIGYLAVFDITDSSAPTLVANPQADFQTFDRARDIAIKDNYLYINLEDSIRVYNISDPLNPSFLSSISFETSSTSSAFEIQGNYLFAVAASAGFYIIDISSPSTPILLTTAKGLGVGTAIDVVDDRVYIANQFGVIDVYDITTISEPVFVTQYDTNGIVKDVAANDSYVFGANIMGIFAEETIGSIENIQ